MRPPEGWRHWDASAESIHHITRDVLMQHGLPVEEVVCRLDEAQGRCVGCHRTLAEIGAWSRLDDEAKRQVWQAIEQRQVG